MSIWRCVHTGILMERQRAGLSEAERLRFETHLEECGQCSRAAHMLGGLAALMDTLPSHTLSQRTRARVLGAALDAGTTPAAHARRESGPAFLIGGSLVAAAAMALLWLILSGHRADERMRATRSRPIINVEKPAASARPAASTLLWGDLEERRGQGPPRIIEVGETVTAHARLHTRGGARLRLGRANLRLAPSGTVRWEPATDTVALQSGKVSVDVAPHPSRGFRVRTQEFIVEVLGTRFEVDQKSVRVLEGSVRVLAPDGKIRVTALEAGRTWHDRSLESEIPTMLEQAREHLAHGRVHAARGLLDRMRDADLRPRQQAEADSLLAECALVAGRQDEAARRYEQVARRYPRLTAGETALFAAARLHARAGHEDEARALLRRYLEHYPSGRFRAQVQDKLGDIEQ